MRIKTQVFFCVVMVLAFAGWQAGTLAAKSKTKLKDLPKARLRIELTGGDDNRPIADASVYLRFQENPKAQKGKMLELNLKTSGEGVALSPEIPQGCILIQIVAPGWKTYGQWHEIDHAEQTVSIHITRPTTKYY